MSQENAAVVRRALHHLAETGDLAEDWYDADVVFMTRSDGPAQSVYRGIKGLQRAMKSFREVWATLEFEILELIDEGEVVVVPLLFHLRSRTGVALDVEETWAYWIRNGKIRRIEQHPSRQAALEAAATGPGG